MCIVIKEGLKVVRTLWTEVQMEMFENIWTRLYPTALLMHLYAHNRGRGNTFRQSAAIFDFVSQSMLKQLRMHLMAP